MIKFIEPTSKDEIVGFLVFTDKDQSIYKVIVADEPIIEIYKAYRAYRPAYANLYGMHIAKDFCKNLNIEFPLNDNDKEIRIEAITFANEYILQLDRYLFIRILYYDVERKFADIIPEYVIDIIKSNIIKDIEEYENAGNETMAMACKVCFDFIDTYFQKDDQ